MDFRSPIHGGLLAGLLRGAKIMLGIVLLLVTASCRRSSPPETGKPAQHPDVCVSSPDRLSPVPELLEKNTPPRLPLVIAPGELTLAPPFPATITPNTWHQDAADSLHNMALAPDDVENGWGWAVELFYILPLDERPPFIDQAASLTPRRAWRLLDPILLDPAQCEEVLQTLYRRLLDLPPSEQFPRLLQIAQIPFHPCREQATSLLQAYFPEIPPGRYEEFFQKIKLLSGL